jgi:hypothetical protein
LQTEDRVLAGMNVICGIELTDLKTNTTVTSDVAENQFK